MIRSILNLAWKELVQLLRDRVLLGFLIIMPVVQLFLIAEATGAGVRHIKFAVWDQEKSEFSQQLVTSLNNTDEFSLYYRASGYTELHDLIDGGYATVGIILPPDLSRNAFRPGETARIQVIIDGTNTIVAGTLLGVLQGAITTLAAQNVSSVAAGRIPGGIELAIDTAFNSTLNFRFSTLPSQLAFITYQLVLVVAAVSLVRERELGTMEQLVVTPISRFQLVLGKSLLALFIGLVNFYFLVLLLTWGFQIPLRGDIALLFGLGVLFIITEIGSGTLISIITTSQQQAILIVFLLAMLEVTFSGYLVPTGNMPLFMRFFAELSPLQHFMVISRAVFLKGATLPMLVNHVLALAGLAAATTTAAWVLFVRTKDW